MDIPAGLLNLGFSQYEIKAYLALVGRHPVNGSQLSRDSGIPRARVYDVLNALKKKGYVVDLGQGQYAPLPPEELLGHLRRSFETNLSELEHRIESAASPAAYDYVWAVQGYAAVLARAREMIRAAREEIYTRLYPAEGRMLAEDLRQAEAQGVAVKYISMGPSPASFELRVEHPEADQVAARLGGRTFDLVVDRHEILVGMLENGREDASPISWARNHWFVTATRDSLRHDFFHCFLHRILEEGATLTDEEKRLYRLISEDV